MGTPRALLKVLLVHEEPARAAELAERLIGLWPTCDVVQRGALPVADDVSRYDVVILHVRSLECLEELGGRERGPALVGLADPEAEEALTAACFDGRLDEILIGDPTASQLTKAVREAVSRRTTMGKLQDLVIEAHVGAANFHQLVTAITDAVVVVDEHGVVQYANPACTGIPGLSPRGALPAAFAEVQGFGTEAEVVLVDGGRRLVLHVRSCPMEWAGGPARLLVARDVTEREEAAALSSALERSERLVAIGRLAAGAAHEINNPLTATQAALQVLERELAKLGADVARATTLVERAQDGAHRVGRIARDLSGFSRDDLEDPLRPTDPRMPLVAALDMAKAHLPGHVELVRDVVGVPQVHVQEGRLCQVYLNLLINAAHALAPVGRDDATLTVRLFERDDEVVTEVRDTGQGIPELSRAKIFEPFFTTKGPFDIGWISISSGGPRARVHCTAGTRASPLSLTTSTTLARRSARPRCRAGTMIGVAAAHQCG